MHFLVYASPAGCAAYAAKQLGHTVQVLEYKANNLEEVCFGQAMGFTKFDRPAVDVFATSMNSADSTYLKHVIAKYAPRIVLWDMGTKAPTKEQINRAIVPLQLAGYRTVLLKNLSSHELGYNYIESRSVVIAKKDEDPIVLPSKIKLKKPFSPLSVIMKTEKDETIIPYHNGNTMFHIEPRPWSFVSKSRGDSYLTSHPLSLKVGAVWYGINGKLHRLSVSEAATIVNYPPEAQKRLLELCQEPGLVVYSILRDMSYSLWLDLYERVS